MHHRGAEDTEKKDNLFALCDSVVNYPPYFLIAKLTFPIRYFHFLAVSNLSTVSHLIYKIPKTPSPDSPH